MWRYGKLKGKFSDDEMNDRFTDIGFSQGHQSCGGARYSKLENRRNPDLGKVPWNLDTHEDRTHNGVDFVVLMSSALTTRPLSCLRRCKKKDANKREPKTWKGWNAKWRNNFDFASSLSQFRIFAFSIVRFRFHNFAF
jgi:hypothetical protein